MDISKMKRNHHNEDIPESIAPSRMSAHHTGGVRRSSHDDMRAQFDEMKEINRHLRNQLQATQSEKEKAMENNRRLQENSKALWKKVDEYKRELEQKNFSQRGQVSRFEHEKLAKHYDQLRAQVRILQHDKERLEQRYQQDKQEIEGRLLDDLKSIKISLEEAEQDRDNLRYKLSEKKRELDRLSEQLACLGPNQEGSKKEIARIIGERDTLRSKVNEMKQEKSSMQSKLNTLNKNIELLKKKVPVDQKVSELQAQVSNLQQMIETLKRDKDELSEANNELKRNLEIVESQYQDMDAECQRLRQSMTELRGISPNRRLQVDRGNGLSHGSSEEMLSKKYKNSVTSRGRSQGSTDDDFFANSDTSDNLNSLTDLTALTRSDSGHIHNLSGGGMVSGGGGGGMMSSGTTGLAPLSITHSGGEMGTARRKLGKFSSSTSNLPNDMFERAHNNPQQNKLLLQKTMRLEKLLEEVKKENNGLQAKVSDLEHERSETAVQLEAVKKQMEESRGELATISGQYKVAKSQIDMLNKEKGVAMRDNAASYEQSIQLETQLRELLAEKQIFEQQKDIAKKEMERVITESVTNKKKLEAIKAQRQKDGSDLSAMRHLKDKALQEAKELRKRVDAVQKSKTTLEEELNGIQEKLHRAALKLSPHFRQKGTSGSPSGRNAENGGSTMTQDLGTVVERLHQLENERKVIMKNLFGAESVEQVHPLGDILHKIESLLQERDDLVVEIDALQQSSSKLSEDRIYELKQRIEDLLMENESLGSQTKSLKREISSLSSHLVKVEQEKEKLAIECERQELQCQQLKNRQARLVEDHTKTLERVSELWKQKWPVAWDDAWEEKYVTVPLDADGLAGFSVVGGRDQPQLPNPGAFIITVVNPGGPAEGILKSGDVLESVNGINLTNADHREAVRAVKETKRSLNIVLRRRRNVYSINVGIVQPINSVPQLTPSTAASTAKPEQLEYSLYITGKEKSDLGFQYDRSTVCTVSHITSSGPAEQILEVGDRIVKVNNSDITHEKGSVIKKLMKPHKNILRLTIERSSRNDRTYMGQLPQEVSSLLPALKTSSSTSAIHAKNWSDSSTPVPSGKQMESDNYTQQSLTSHGSYSTLDRIGERTPAKDDFEGCGASNISHYKSRSRNSYSSRDSREMYSQETQSQDSGNKPTKLVSVVTGVKDQKEEPRPAKPSSIPATRPSSDGVIYGNFNERRIEYEEVLLSERSDSQFSQSESFLSESSYDYGLSSSQSIDLTFHTVSTIPTHNRLTVDTVMTTQAPSQQSEDEDAVGFMARDDASRVTVRTRNSNDPSSNSNGNNSETREEPQPETSQLSESQSLSQEFIRGRKGYGIGIRRRPKTKHQKSNSISGSRTFSKSSSDQNLARGSSNLAMRGRSRSNLSLGRAPSMTSVIEEPRRSTSTTDMMQYEHDPLADATYIRANFTYIPRNPKELNIKSGDVFHIHDEAPSERFRSSFWASRLSADGTDEQIGAIPNSMKAQEYVDAQGESLDFALYEEVEPYTGNRPVVIFGVLADQVVNSLLESFPKLFYPCPTNHVEGAVRLTEARLRRESTEGKIIDFKQTEGGFEVVRLAAINGPQSKNKHCLMTGSSQALQTLKAVAPPIAILVKAMTEESITTFSPEHISQEQAKEIYDDVTQLEERHGHEFSAALFLIYMETLMGQIEDIIKAEKRKQAWVPVARQHET